MLLLFLFWCRDGKCPLSGKYNIEYHRDKNVDKTIKKLFVTCENKNVGCMWCAELQHYEVTTLFIKIDHIFLILDVHVFKVVEI